MIHSPLSSPSMRGVGSPAALTASRTLAASDLVCRLLVPEATITRSNSGDRCSVLKTTMSCALTSSSPSTMARCSLRMSIQLLVVVVGVAAGTGGVAQYSARPPAGPDGIDRLAGARRGADVGRRLGHHRQRDRSRCARAARSAGRRRDAPGRGGDGQGDQARPARASRARCAGPRTGPGRGSGTTRRRARPRRSSRTVSSV